VWELSADLMKAQSGDKTDDRLRGGGGDERQPMMLGNRSIGQPVSASCYAFEGAGVN
jgi:hypothetical protein